VNPLFRVVNQQFRIYSIKIETLAYSQAVRGDSLTSE
jgi:hypothetical protein